MKVLNLHFICTKEMQNPGGIVVKTVQTGFLRTKSPFEFVFSSCEFTKVMFVLKLSGIQRKCASDERLFHLQIFLAVLYY